MPYTTETFPESGLSSRVRELRLIWKNPTTRRYHDIGRFGALPNGRYSFSYLEDIEGLEGFSPLVQFPDTSTSYISDVLPAFFANRVMSRRRRSYHEYLGWLGLDASAPPVEILARTGGGRATDTFHLVELIDDEAEPNRCRFFSSGASHLDDPEVLDRVFAGCELDLVDEPTNEYNPLAIRLCAGEHQIGWVPDWLVDDVHRLRPHHHVRVIVDQVNHEAPLSLAVLCRLEATYIR